ncbi:MAG: RluA family pseudouridine synthase [Ruminococcus sp.]|nr:RluA family pseudouridine synthase [Ruminococcus sp.]
MKEYQIQENDSGQRLDRFLQKVLPQLPKNLFYKWIRTKHIKVNRKRCKPDQHLFSGDRVVLYVSDSYFDSDVQQTTEDKFKSYEFLQAPNELTILFENTQILIVCKPVGLVVHCDNRQVPDTLIHRILYYLYDTGAYNPAQELSFTPALCNRLDRNTGGIVIVAKTAAALREVNRLIRENRIQKTYLCTVVGTPPKLADTLYAWHKKSDTHNTVTICDEKSPGFQEIITGYHVLAKNAIHSLLSVHLITGRTHQIRAHLAHIGVPILGDNKYGNGKENCRSHCKYQQLWAYQLTLETNAGTCLADLNGLTIRTALPTFVQKEFPQFQLAANELDLD